MIDRLKSSNSLPILIILVLATLIVWPLFQPGYFSHHDDLQVMRIVEMRKCLEDLQIPCRWVPDMGYGNGFPLFNFYGVFPYLLGALFSFFFGYIVSAKILFFIPLVLSGLSMYFLGNKLYGRFAGLVAGILYMFAPYRALDLYVRGDVTESFSLAIAPLIFYFLLKLMEKSNYRNVLYLTFTLAAFLTTHNIMTMLFTPLIILWVIIFVISKKIKNLGVVIFSILLGYGLAAFFLIPAITEINLVQIDSLKAGDLNFRAHFVTVNQLLFDRIWGYGASILGPGDTISFQIGWPHWLLAIIALVFFVYKIFSKKNTLKEIDNLIFIFFALLFLGSIIMMHNKSAFFWEQIQILHFTQFPWRFLSLTVFTSSLIAGYLIRQLNPKWQIPLAIFIIGLTVILNFSFFKPEKFFYQMTDQEKLSDGLWDEQRKAALLDYLPKTALEPREPAPLEPFTLSGEGQVQNFINRSNRWSFTIEVNNRTTVIVPVFDFPVWKVKVDNQSITHNHSNINGHIQFDLDSGKHNIVGEFHNTFIRTLANLITVISAYLILFVPLYGRHKKVF